MMQNGMYSLNKMTFGNYLSFLFRIKRKLVQVFMLRLNPIKFALYGIKLGKQPRICNHVYLHVYPKSSVMIGDSFTMTSGETSIRYAEISKAPSMRNAKTR